MSPVARHHVTTAVLLCVGISALVGWKWERASLGNTWHFRRHEWWYLGVVLESNGTHRVFVNGDIDAPFPVREDEYLVVGINCWATEEYLNRGHWLLDGLEIEHRLETDTPRSFSSDPADAISGTLDARARVYAAQLVAPLLNDFAHQPSTIQNGYTWSDLNEQRLALRVALLGACAVCGGLLAVRLGHWARRDWRLSTGRCMECGYALVGLPPDTPCPECGGKKP